MKEMKEMKEMFSAQTRGSFHAVEFIPFFHVLHFFHFFHSYYKLGVVLLQRYCEAEDRTFTKDGFYHGVAAVLAGEVLT